MLVCPLSIFTALALVSIVGEKGKTGVKQLKKGKKKIRERSEPPLWSLAQGYSS